MMHSLVCDNMSAGSVVSDTSQLHGLFAPPVDTVDIILQHGEYQFVPSLLTDSTCGNYENTTTLVRRRVLFARGVSQVYLREGVL